MMNQKRNAVVLGVTGGVACGKSEVGRILREMGFSVCDADGLAHDLMKKGSSVYQQVVNHFGMDILSDDGEISRSILGKIVFENPAELTVLNGLVHPAVRKNLEDWIENVRLQNTDAAALVPLLFESGMNTMNWDAIVCVSSSEDLVSRRLEKRGFNRAEAKLRVESQMLLAEKEQGSNSVIPNVGTLKELEESTRKIVNRIKAKRVL